MRNIYNKIITNSKNKITVWLQPTEKKKQYFRASKFQNMSYVRIWVHLVFSTKNRNPFLTKEIRVKLHQHIIENCKKKEIFLQAINGYTDHLHCLISLGKEQSIAKIAQLIKGESSLWINKEQLTEEKFMWQDDYFANSVSESIVEKVIRYIDNQEKHHSKKSFDDEVNKFMEIYGWKKLNNFFSLQLV